jgi:membrane protein required for colicin V production
MLVDILCLVALLTAIFKGYQKGLIVAVFSIVGFVIGWMAAMKFSTVVAGWLASSTQIEVKWLPVIAFLLVFIAAVLLVRLGAKFLQSAVEMALMGWLNKIGGILFYLMLYVLVISTLLFFAEQLQVLTSATIQESKCYSWVKPVAPFFMNTIGTVLPVFKNMFSELEQFFNKLNQQLPATISLMCN